MSASPKGRREAPASFRAQHTLWSDRKLFLLHASHDRDGDGSISRHEFLKMLTHMQLLQPIARQPPASSPEEGVRIVEEAEEDSLDNHARAARVFESVDVDESGGLSAGEFIEAYHRFVLEDPAGIDEASSAAHAGTFSFSRVTITAVKWWPGAPALGSQEMAVSYLTYATSSRGEPPELAQMRAFVAAAAEGGAAGAPTVWVDVSGPQHQATLEWLRGLGLECATTQAFREEGVWQRGALGHPTWASPPPPPPPSSAPAWSGALLPALWLANTPFRTGSARALGCCKWRGAQPAARAAHRSLHWLLCGTREGTVVVEPHQAEAAAGSSHAAVEGADAALAKFWANYVARFSKGGHSEGAEEAGAGASAGSKAAGARAHRVSTRELLLRRGQGEAEGLIEAMVRGGEFHVVSQSHLRSRAPHLVRHVVGIFTIAAGAAAAGAGVEKSGASSETLPAPAPTPALLLTLRPCDEWGMVSSVLDGFRGRVQGRTAFLAARAAPSGHGGREACLMRSLDAPLLAAAIADSLGVRFNDLLFRVLEHWATVLRACVQEQPSSLHQRHLTHLGELAARAHEHAAKLVLSQAQLTGSGSSDQGAGAASSGMRDFFDTFSRRAAHLEQRGQRLLQRVRDLQDQYKTRLDEDRNWMVTALTLFTAGTWPLSFLTGYFGMCVPC